MNIVIETIPLIRDARNKLLEFVKSEETSADLDN
jgi:hypothetical protein